MNKLGDAIEAAQEKATERFTENPEHFLEVRITYMGETLALGKLEVHDRGEAEEATILVAKAIADRASAVRVHLDPDLA